MLKIYSLGKDTRALNDLMKDAGVNTRQRGRIITSMFSGKNTNARFEARAAELGKIFKPTEGPGKLSDIRVRAEAPGRFGINSSKAGASLPSGKELETLSRIVERFGYKAPKARAIAKKALTRAEGKRLSAAAYRNVRLSDR